MKARRALSLTFFLCALGAGVLEGQVSTVDSLGNVGQFSSVTIGSDGLPLISYALVATVSNLKIAHCNDAACASAPTITTLDADNGGLYTAIAVGADGLGLIAYARSDTNLKVAHCGNIACTSATLTILDAGVFSTVDLAIGADGLGLISYFDDVNNDLKVAHCSNATCTSATITTLDPTPPGGWYTSVGIGADGLGLVAYTSGNLAGPGGDVVLKAAHCNNPGCTSATISTVDSGVSQPGEYVGLYPATAIGPDGLGLISYQYQKTGSPQELRIAHCSNANCTGAVVSTIETATQTGVQTSIAIGADGFAVVSYLFQTASRDLKLARCSDLGCSTATFKVIDGPGVGLYSSIAIGKDNLPIISYFDEANFDLKAAHCLDRFCGAPPPPLGFHTLTPCRMVDTRGPAGPLAGPALAATADRVFNLAGVCGIPPSAKALSVNQVVTGSSVPGNLRLHPAGTLVPLTSSINYATGHTRANNAIAPLSALGALAVYCGQASGTVHFILDVNGYFE
jgi:hypothetical protein